MRLPSPDFESGASANSATSAQKALVQARGLKPDPFMTSQEYPNRRQNMQAGDFFPKNLPSRSLIFTRR